LCSFNVSIDEEVKAERETPQLGLLIYLSDYCLSVQIIESYTCVSQRIGSDPSYLTRCAYVSGPYWSVRERWQIIHVSYTYDTGKMKIKCNLCVTTHNSFPSPSRLGPIPAPSFLVVLSFSPSLSDPGLLPPCYPTCTPLDWPTLDSDTAS